VGIYFITYYFAISGMGDRVNRRAQTVLLGRQTGASEKADGRHPENLTEIKIISSKQVDDAMVVSHTRMSISSSMPRN